MMDNPYNCLFCLILAVWSTVFIEVWKRRECEIAHNWNMSDYKGTDSERTDYVADYVIDKKQKASKKFNVADTYQRRLWGEMPSITFAIGIVVACFYGYYRMTNDHKGDTNYSIGSSIVNAFIIIILGVIYRAFALILVNWENHKYIEDWENSLISKNFAF